MRVRDYLGISKRRQAQISRLMQLSLVGMIAIGIDRGNLGIVVNAGIGLTVTYLPALLERDFEISMDPALILWITTAVFLHALGTVGIPGSGLSFYTSVPWWDHLTHTLSASVVAAAGYVTARAFDRHTDAVRFPPRFTFVFVLLFVVAFGVFWEVIEFTVGGIASLTGSGSVLTQYGLADTMMDLVFDVVGGVVAATWGTAYLTDAVGAVQRKLDGRRSNQ